MLCSTEPLSPEAHHWRGRADGDRPAAEAVTRVLGRALGRASDPLRHPARFTGRLRRGPMLLTLMLAVVVLVVARAMDHIVFGSTPGNVPAFFVFVAAFPLIAALPAACVRRLRDAGLDPRLSLLLTVPLVGWGVLVALLCRPSRRIDLRRRSEP